MRALSAVLVARGPLDAVTTSILALGDAIDVAEAQGRTVDVALVDACGDRDVAALLATVEGASVVAGSPDERLDEAHARGMAATSGELVWLGTSESALGGDALLALAAALDRDPQAGRAVPHPDPGAYAMVTRGGGARTVLVRGAGARRERVRTRVRPPSFGPALVETGALSVGPATYASPGCVLRTYAPTERIELGGYCSIAHDVRLVNPGGALHDADGAPLHPLVRGEHRPQCASTFPIGVLVPEATFDEVPPDVVGPALVVGDDVWIGTGALIVGGLTIGPGAIVGAGAVVVRDVAPYTVVAGNPAKPVRRRFDDATCERLERIAWWDWPPEIVRANWRAFTAPIEDFVARFDPGRSASSG